MMDEKVMKTGTTTVAIVAKDGIVLAADKRATAGNFIANKRIRKIYEVSDNMALTMAGTVSDAQLLCKLIKAELKLKKMRTGRDATVKESANLLANLVYSNIRKFSVIPGIAHFLFAGKDNTGFHVYDLYPDGSLSETEDFVSSGSGSVMAYGVLETLYNKDISVDDAVKLAVKAINAALQRDSASGGGIDVVTITKDGVKRAFEKEVKGSVEA
ncbi:proteasome subunit beta [Candidatus Woesearchaeota archaeon]|nr:MAG: proteasome subunit beta [Candidatus Woesearchaeota archaeon]